MALAVALEAAGTMMSGLSKAGAASFGAQVARNNATMAQQKESYVAASSVAQTEQEGLKARSKLSGMRAGFAANNLDVNSGSPADVQTSQREIGALDQAQVANKAAVEAYGYRVQAQDYAEQAKLDRSEAISDVVGSVLGSAGKIASGSSVSPTAATGSEDAGSADIGKSLSDPTVLEGGGSSVPDDYAWMQDAGALGMG